MAQEDGDEITFPRLVDVAPEPLEYARQVLDFLLWGGKPYFMQTSEEIAEASTVINHGEIIGFLKEFAEIQHQKP